MADGVFIERHAFGPVASDVLCCAIAPDGANVAMGCTNGEIIIHQASSPFAKVAVLRPEASSVTEPVTCIRYLPAASGDKASNMMLAAYGSGCVRRWHVTSGQCVHEQQVSDDGLSCIDVHPKGQQYAVGGNDNIVRVIDLNSHDVVATLGPGRGFRSAEVGLEAPLGHTNRVFSVKYHPSKENVVLSGGWDNTIQVWDISESRPTGYMAGPFLGGDALDIDGRHNRVLVGSYRKDDSLELWDIETKKRIKTFFTQMEECWVYCCKYVNGPKGPTNFIAAAGSKKNELRLVDRSTGNTIGTFASPSGGLFTLDATADGTLLATAGAGKVLTLLDVVA